MTDRLTPTLQNKSTHCISNKTIRPRLRATQRAASWTANVDFVQFVDYKDFDI